MKLRRSAILIADSRQRGSYLLEALIAILIFAFGVLGLIGLLGSSVRVTNDARSRAEAANIASALLADIWTTPPAQVATDFGNGGAKLAEWQTKAEALLPSAAAHPISVVLTPGLSSESRTVVVTVYWQMPGETELHRQVVSAQVGRNRTLP